MSQPKYLLRAAAQDTVLLGCLGLSTCQGLFALLVRGWQMLSAENNPVARTQSSPAYLCLCTHTHLSRSLHMWQLLECPSCDWPLCGWSQQLAVPTWRNSVTAGTVQAPGAPCVIWLPDSVHPRRLRPGPSVSSTLRFSRWYMHLLGTGLPSARKGDHTSSAVQPHHVHGRPRHEPGGRHRGSTSAACACHPLGAHDSAPPAAAARCS